MGLMRSFYEKNDNDDNEDDDGNDVGDDEKWGWMGYLSFFVSWYWSSTNIKLDPYTIRLMFYMLLWKIWLPA